MVLDARALARVRPAAIGPGTARALARHGLKADLIPEVYDASHLGEALAAQAAGQGPPSCVPGEGPRLDAGAGTR